MFLCDLCHPRLFAQGRGSEQRDLAGGRGDAACMCFLSQRRNYKGLVVLLRPWKLRVCPEAGNSRNLPSRFARVDSCSMNFNEALDLRFERKVNCSPAHLWKGWTDPETLKKWFCPLPWKVTDCAIELQPGGKFWNVMQGPNGERQDNTGCYLEVVPEKRLVWTGALLPEFRPAPVNELGFAFTAVVEFLAQPDGGTLYRATVMHRTIADRDVHAKIGFEIGWGLALDQLLALA